MITHRAICVLLVSVGLAAFGCERTTVEGPEAQKLTVVKPADTTIERGSTAEVAVAIERENVAGPVTVEFSDLPDGVTVVDETAEIEGEERTFVLQADESAALVGDQIASVTLSGPDGMTATEEFRITVRDRR